MNNIRAYVSDLISLTKPPIISLLLVTATGAIFLASDGSPPLLITIYILIGGTLGAAGASVINNVIDRNIDKAMIRTSKRAVPSRRITPTSALVYGILLNVFSFILLNFTVNFTSAFLTIFASLFYIFIYTIYLKPRTTQNIVIGGAAGCFPPVIAWVGIIGYEGLFNLSPWFMFLIVFLWTPPHFWALALVRADEYKQAGVPMLPVVVGAEATRRYIFWYSIALVSFTFAPVVIGLSGVIYGIGAALLGAIFVTLAVLIRRRRSNACARRLFSFSILYLFLIFVLLAVDHMSWSSTFLGS